MLNKEKSLQLKNCQKDKFLNLIKFQEDWRKNILAWSLFSVFINIIIMYLNPIYIDKSIESPFIHNLFMLIINSTIFISIGMFLILFRYRNLYFSIYSVIWVGLGLASSMLKETRGTPLTKYDFAQISEGMGVVQDFLTNSHYFKIAIFVFFAILIIIIGTLASKKAKKFNFKNILISWGCVLIISTSISGIALAFNSSHLDDYAEFGFVYGFTKNITTPEFKKPSGYKKSTMISIKNKLDDSYSSTSNINKPNVIAVQLESFFDPKTVEGLKLSENPIPYFDLLRKNYSSGVLKVPTIGGGTARSEFEFITGMSLRNMIDGLIPHNDILKEKPYLSNAYVLKDNGYKTHLLHNFAGYFYNRDVVYNNLGFDTFTSLEFLANGSTNPSVIKASKDDIFPSEIKKILKSTDEKDFIFGITAQLHGNYEETYNAFENGITAHGGFKKEVEGQINDYVNEIKSIDNVIKDIVKSVEEVDEPTIIIFYSDHLPPLNYSDTNISGSSKFEVPYVVWDNIGLEKDDENMDLNKLLSKYMNLSGIEGNYLNKLHTMQYDSETNEKYQDLIQYDIMYGDNYIGEKLLPYKMNTKLGIDDIEIEEVYKDGITYTFKGKGFTPMMLLVVDGIECGVAFENESTVKVSTNADWSGKDVYMKIQIGKNTDSILKSNIYELD